MQIVIAYDREKKKARYAGRLLLGQAKPGEELIILDVSELELLDAKRFPDRVKYDEKTNSIKVKDPDGQVQDWEQQVYNNTATVDGKYQAEDKFDEKRKIKKTTGLKTSKDKKFLSFYGRKTNENRGESDQSL